ncbi:glycosyltransferase family 4 protein [Vibrio genomosp. F10 str. 9ZC157]|uniref:Colanic acid biosynthesis glycosyltransferase WcaL n=1 Tax=Vibrio genomosp. F10 str. ZF-129 TaxID=1187848 RepID=A0A1E5BH23_9VIBR|nr:glycosyltransferase family 4 protein [Vibrio genomosp. F10]OEE35824.1 colanic acid biosynthesis glycosyltransferase WcaL [Vibrio genomosp. F10 str. ZF-129]OEE97044.1 colanic acid biosynthesis glycosyltransferase WcaL [Vibrio genomosp. F10 str. 9ZC157]
MKKVAFVTPTYPVLSETFIQTEIDAIKQCGHHVCVLTFEIEQSQQTFDYSVIKIGSKVKAGLCKKFYFPGLLDAIKFVQQQKSMPRRSLFNYGVKLALQLADLNVEHVHAHFCQHTAAHAIVAAKLLNITCSFVAHGHDVYESAYDIEQKIQASDFVVAVCKSMHDDFVSMMSDKIAHNKSSENQSPENKTASAKIKLLHCGVKTDQFVLETKTRTRQLRLVFLGRLVEQKGIHHLIEALAPIAKPLSIRLDIVGTGEMLHELEKQVKQQGLLEDVHFLGAKPHEWVKQNLAKYDCLVAPFCFSQTGCVDTGPLVLKEAMAVGTPVITTNIMGCKEIVAPGTGFLVSEKSVAELKQSIMQFSQFSIRERTQMGQLAHKHVTQNFDAFLQAKQLSGWIEAPATT